ncbi:MAG: flagellar biosynthetic protein FliO [Candidatus Deferrimicrobiaceae bacterium]
MKRFGALLRPLPAAFATVLASAAHAAPAAGAAAAEGPSLGWAALKMLLALALVLAILLALSRYSKRYLERFSKGRNTGKSVSIIEIRQTGPKTQVMVMEAFGAKYLLGVTPTKISVIDKIPSEGSGENA